MGEILISKPHVKLSDERADYVRRCLARVKEALATSTAQDECLDVLISFFHIDPLDRPELVPLLDEALDVVASVGERMVPRLLEVFDGADLKAQLAAGHALGRIGLPAMRYLLRDYEEATTDTRRSLILYALGKIQTPEIVEAVPIALAAAESPDRELRDTAVRAIGKFAESIPEGSFPPELVVGAYAMLRSTVADPTPHVRAKAVRSLGKLARYGHLDPDRRTEVRELCEQILGKEQNWDNAYIVRHEALEALEEM